MKWQKLGLIVEPGQFTWMKTHAQNPFAVRTGENTFKVFFASRDSKNRARGGFVEIDIEKPGEIIEISRKPVLDLGEIGCFDDCGVMPSCLVSHNTKHYLYYTGWSQAVVTPFTFFIGLAISTDGGKTFDRYSQAPVLGRTKHDPYLTASPWVLIEDNIWKMWYVSGTGWEIEKKGQKPKHYYLIKYAESQNGIEWDTSGHICIPFRNNEYAIARPVVHKESPIYEMWYSFRGGKRTYRIGYAESGNGTDWVRKDKEAGINVSKCGWDSEMICYPFVFDHKGTKYMLYNGNGYGNAGFGLAMMTR